MRLKLVCPCPTLPTKLSSYTNLRRIQMLDFSHSHHLCALPNWISEIRQLESLVLRGCINLKKLPESLWQIYDKYKNLLLDLTGCAHLFFESHVDDSISNSTPSLVNVGRQHAYKDLLHAHACFRDSVQLEIVRELLRKAENDHALDQVTVYDGLGIRFEKPSSMHAR